jgi:transcriptional regulator with XRE-family HTH domain
MIKVGETIRKFRTLKGYSQESMAQQLGLSPNGYAKIERDETDISLKRLEAIADILKVNIFKILNFDDKLIFSMDNHQNQNNSGTIQPTQQINTCESLKTLVSQLQEDVLHLRAQNSALMQQNIALIELMKNK